MGSKGALPGAVVVAPATSAFATVGPAAPTTSKVVGSTTTLGMGRRESEVDWDNCYDDRVLPTEAGREPAPMFKTKSPKMLKLELEPTPKVKLEPGTEATAAPAAAPTPKVKLEPSTEATAASKLETSTETADDDDDDATDVEGDDTLPKPQQLGAGVMPPTVADPVPAPEAYISDCNLFLCAFLGLEALAADFLDEMDEPRGSGDGPTVIHESFTLNTQAHIARVKAEYTTNILEKTFNAVFPECQDKRVSRARAVYAATHMEETPLSMCHTEQSMKCRFCHGWIQSDTLFLQDMHVVCYLTELSIAPVSKKTKASAAAGEEDASRKRVC